MDWSEREILGGWPIVKRLLIPLILPLLAVSSTAPLVPLRVTGPVHVLLLKRPVMTGEIDPMVDERLAVPR